MEHLETTASKSNRPKLTFKGKVLLGITGVSFAAVCAGTAPFIMPALRKVCLPFVPATTQQVNNVMHLLKGQRGKLVDLGSGDGRIVIEAAKHGFQAEGIELNPWLVWYSRWRAWRTGVSSQTAFHTRDLWKEHCTVLMHLLQMDLGHYDNIVIFGVESMMDTLQEKLICEMHQDARVLACRFPLPAWTPIQSTGEGIDTVWLYTNTVSTQAKTISNEKNSKSSR